jgi:predicted transcriptional regulator
VAIQILNEKRFSRLHLRLFLLVDGQRSVVELARLIGKKPEEVQKLLNDLEAIGIIRQ